MNMEIACRENNCDHVRTLLKAEADINAVVNRITGNRALHVAVEVDAIDVVTLLVECGANIDVRGWCGHTSLHRAIIHGRAEIITYLLSHHADITLSGKHNNTPLHFVVLFNNTTDIVTQLITAGSNVDAKNDNGRTALHDMFYYLVRKSWKKKSLLLLLAGANINTQDLEGFTILHHVVNQQNNIDKVHFLLEHGASAEIRNEEGTTAVDLAQDEAIVTLLQEHIASQDVKNAGRRK